MREIDLSQSSAARRTILLYGATRTGKTHFAATAPRPLIISDGTESGWTTIANMDPDLWWERGVKPLVWTIDKTEDMAAAYVKAMPLVLAGKVRSIAIDSLSFYSDLYLAYLYNLITSHDTRKIYGELGIHLRDLRVKWHQLPCNVIWLCLVKEPDEENKMGGPLIPGQQATKFTAGCDNIMYIRATATERFIHTKRYLGYIAGGREGSRVVADTLPEPTFRSYLQTIGDPEQAVDGPVGPVTSHSAPVRPAAAPVAPIRPSVTRAPIAARTPVRPRT